MGPIACDLILFAYQMNKINLNLPGRPEIAVFFMFCYK